MKLYLLSLLLISLFISSCGETTSPEDNTPKGVVFPNAPYNKVVAYHFEDLQGHPIIDNDGALNPTVKKEKQLSEDEIKQFLSVINNDDTYGGSYTRCFKPRLGVVFYDNDKPTAHISICFECSQQISSPTIQAYTNAPLGEHGYSEVGFQSLTTFCRKLSFGQCGG